MICSLALSRVGALWGGCIVKPNTGRASRFYPWDSVGIAVQVRGHSSYFCSTFRGSTQQKQLTPGARKVQYLSVRRAGNLYNNQLEAREKIVPKKKQSLNPGRDSHEKPLLIVQLFNHTVDTVWLIAQWGLPPRLYRIFFLQRLDQPYGFDCAGRFEHGDVNPWTVLRQIQDEFIATGCAIIIDGRCNLPAKGIVYFQFDH